MINFHSEKPANQDLFPGGSHEKVAAAMQAYITASETSQVIGLDGEFGSGKSSILEMLGSKLKAADDDYRVWFFDCEQNYQGSTKSNFIELFTDELLKDVRSNSKDAEALIRHRDVALGREFKYSKKTTSNVSAWALLLLVSLFFSSSSFKELFKLAQPAFEVARGLKFVNWTAFLSPAVVLVLAWACNHNKDIGDGKKWSLLSLFKGSSHDFINEKIEVSKEVTPLDLKRTLIKQLELLSKQRYVVILDNLDRLPKESLRSVWSDLEIFTSVAAAENLTVIVPFCSTKVAAYLGADADRKYDARDFIAKKFPVVFRAPPVITSGWKDGFRQMWKHTFTNTDVSIAEHCAQLLHRHTPMANDIVTPRLQKKFINDIATTSLVVGDHINLICIAVHLLLCRYNEFPVEEVLRDEGLSADYKELASLKDTVEGKVAQTNTLLNTVIGQDMNNGWQIQILQVHFLTTSEIAIAELLDEPLYQAIEAADEDKLYSLTSLFGFADAFKRLIAKNLPLSRILPLIHSAHEKHGGVWVKEAIQQINECGLALLPESNRGGIELYDSIRYCITVGFNADNVSEHGELLKGSIERAISESYSANEFDQLRTAIKEYDMYLTAIGENFSPMAVKSAEYIMHLLSEIETLEVIKPHHFKLELQYIETAYHQLACTESRPLDMVPLEAGRVIPAACWAFKNICFGKGLSKEINFSDIMSIYSVINADDDAAIISLAFSESIDYKVQNAISSLLSSNSEDIIRTVAAIVYIREQDAASLISIAGIEDIVKSEFFRSLANAAVKTTELMPLLLNEAANTVAPFMAYLILDDHRSTLNTEWLLKNYSEVKFALQPHGVTQHDIINWVDGWDSHIAKQADEPLIIDPMLVEEILATPENKFKLFKEASFKFLDSTDRGEEGWKELIEEASPQVVSIARAMVEQSITFSSAELVSGAIVATLHAYVHDEDAVKLNTETLTIVDILLQALDEQLKHVIGGHLRALFYSSPKDINRLFNVIENYGHLILDIQPANSDEATQLIRLLDYIGRHPEATQPVATFLDQRADQLSRYKYSGDLRKGMASIVTKLDKLTPAISRRFSRKIWFKDLFKSQSLEKDESGGKE